MLRFLVAFVFALACALPTMGIGAAFQKLDLAPSASACNWDEIRAAIEKSVKEEDRWRVFQMTQKAVEFCWIGEQCRRETGSHGSGLTDDGRYKRCVLKYLV